MNILSVSQESPVEVKVTNQVNVQPALTKWEYYSITVNPAEGDLDGKLTKEGKKGWELVTTVGWPGGNNRFMFIFKRPLN